MTWYIHRFNGSKLKKEKTSNYPPPIEENFADSAPEVEGKPPTEKAPAPPSKPTTKRRTRKSRWPEDEATD